MRVALLAIALICASHIEAVHAATITEIEVVENTKTSDATVILIAGIRRGQKWHIGLIDSIKVELVSSGLFKHVDVFTTDTPRGIRVTIIARDKHSWVIAPTIYNQPTNKGGGLGFGENNLFGENKKLLLYGQVATQDSFFVGAYVDPSIGGTRWRWQYDLYLQHQRVIEYSVPQHLTDPMKPVRQSKINYLNSGIRLGRNLTRDLTLDLRVRGAYVFYQDLELPEGATLADVTDDPGATEIPKPGAEGWDVSSEVILQYDTRANWYGIRSGDRYKVTYERSLGPLGSDFDYWYTTWLFQRARRYFGTHNLVLTATLSLGDNMPFQQEFLSGGVDLRGYKNQVMRGNARQAATVEYSIPLFSIKGFALRGLAFWDYTYTRWIRSQGNTSRNYLPNYDCGSCSRSDRILAGWKNAVGLGTRVYLRQIVLPLLGLDIGYGLENRAYEIYFAIGLTDF